MPAGRLSILHKRYADQRARLLEALRVGAFMDTACSHAGFSTAAVYAHLAAAETEDATKAQLEFAEAVKAARDHSELRALTLIQTDSSWQSKAWFLERTRPDKYGRRTRLEHSGAADGLAVQVAVRDEHKDAVARAILQGLAGIPMQPPDDTA